MGFRMRSVALPLLLALTACSDVGILSEVPIPPLTLSLEQPTYGEFTGNGPMTVIGHVSPPAATVTVEGQIVAVGSDGTFTVDLPYEKPYRILDVTADYFEDRQEIRIPAFAGTDPLLSWPGAITARLTPTGLDGVADLLGGVVDGLVTEQAILDAVPEIGGGTFTLGVTGVSRQPVIVDLDPQDDGIHAHFELRDVRLDILASADLFGLVIEVPGALTFPKIGLDALVDAGIDETTGGIVVGLLEPKTTFDIPVVELFGFGLDWLSQLISNFFDVSTLLDQLLAGVLGNLESIPLGGPLQFDTNLLGTRIAIALQDVSTDRLGVGLSLGVGLNGPVPSAAADVPIPEDLPSHPDLAVLLHDGLLQLLLDSDLLALLEQDIVLPGFLGFVLDPLIGGLPGGEQLPDHSGWCITLAPGTARAARFGVGDAPLGGIYLPDANVTFGYQQPGSQDCTDWLVASLAIELYLDVTEGTKIGIALEVPEGKVLTYGAVGADEDEVVAKLGGVISSLLDLLGGALNIDLGELLGGLGGSTGLPTDSLSISIGERIPATRPDGTPIDGGVFLGLDLFGAPATTTTASNP